MTLRIGSIALLFSLSSPSAALQKIGQLSWLQGLGVDVDITGYCLGYTCKTLHTAPSLAKNMELYCTMEYTKICGPVPPGVPDTSLLNEVCPSACTSTPGPTPVATPVATPAPAPCVGATCTVMQDPHVTSFDGVVVALLATHREKIVDGDKWLVKSRLVSIQARYMTDDADAHGGQFVRALAVSGDFLKGNALIIGSLQDDITWNGNAILRDSSSSFLVSEGDFFVNATRGEHSRHVEDPNIEGPGVSVELPMGVALTVNRLHSHVNVAITMPPQDGGQGGVCGNFNGISTDDSLELANKLFPIDVLPEDSLFPHLITPIVAGTRTRNAHVSQ